MPTTDVPAVRIVRAMCQNGAARDLRVRAGLTLADVAERVGVTRTSVWRWEHAERLPSGQHAVDYWAVLTERDDRLGERT